VRLHPHSVDHGVGPASVGQVSHRVVEVLAVLAQIQHLDTPRAGPLESFGYQVDRDHPSALVLGDAGGHVADGSKAQHGNRAALGHVGVRDGLPRRGQHVGEVSEPVVRRALRHLDVGVLGLRHPQELGLTARHLAVELGEPEQRGTHALLAHLGGLTLAEQLGVTHVAVPTGHLERDDHPITDLEVADVTAHFLDDAHRLVPEDVPLAHERAQSLVQVQVGSADVGGGHPDDGVGGLLDRGVGHGVHADVALALPGHCFHGVPQLAQGAGVSCARCVLNATR